MSWFERIKGYFDKSLWSEKMVKDAVAKGKITAAEFKTVTGKAYKG